MDFPFGVLFGPSHLRIHGNGDIVIGNETTTHSNVHVHGSIQSRKGLPSDSAGFSFLNDADTGLFAFSGVFNSLFSRSFGCCSWWDVLVVCVSGF